MNTNSKKKNVFFFHCVSPLFILSTNWDTLADDWRHPNAWKAAMCRRRRVWEAWNWSDTRGRMGGTRRVDRSLIVFSGWPGRVRVPPSPCPWVVGWSASGKETSRKESIGQVGWASFCFCGRAWSGPRAVNERSRSRAAPDYYFERGRAEFHPDPRAFWGCNKQASPLASFCSSCTIFQYK